MRTIEVCCGTINDAIQAQKGGATRIELCAALACGGLTPSKGTIAQTIATCPNLNIHVIIRPREGDFVYTTQEVEIMRQDIRLCRQLGVHGIVIGALTPQGNVDLDTSATLIREAGNMSVTFHRAFDVCADPFQALEDIITIGCHRLLTSGQAPTAQQGAPLIAHLVSQAANRLIVMPGCGVTPQNIAEIEQITAATEFHSTARALHTPQQVYANPNLSFGENIPFQATHQTIVHQLIHNSL